jgi:hypothetical protein
MLVDDGDDEEYDNHQFSGCNDDANPPQGVSKRMKQSPRTTK